LRITQECGPAPFAMKRIAAHMKCGTVGVCRSGGRPARHSKLTCLVADLGMLPA
jgi:hypothetical protein